MGSSPLAYMATYATVVAFSSRWCSVKYHRWLPVWRHLGNGAYRPECNPRCHTAFPDRQNLLRQSLTSHSWPVVAKDAGRVPGKRSELSLSVTARALFPFFVVNLVPAFLGVALSTYILGTFIGIIPGAFVYASVGAGLGSLFAAGGEFSAKGILTPQILVALTGLAVLALMPVVYKKLTGRRTGVPKQRTPHVTT